MPYEPALDGMRALAVGAVLAYHAGLPWARGGFLGVDAFFVLSGYLITALLLAERTATGRIDLRAFWARRARRLFPALLLVVAGVAWYAAAVADPDELAGLRADAVATLAYVANWREVFAGDSYFDQFAAPSPLLHTWSLAIEEQWYVVWPLVVAALLRVGRGSRGPLLVAAAGLTLASATMMALLFDSGGDPSRVYYGTDTRAQSLLVGAALAIVLASPRVRRRLAAARWPLEVAAVASFALLAWAWWSVSGESATLYRGGFLLLALAVAAVIVAASHPVRGPLQFLLARQPLPWLGRISYGVYLWHWPLYLVLTPDRTGWDGYALFALRAGATLLAATLSYYLVEAPIRRGAFPGRRALWIAAPAAATAVLAGVWLVADRPGPAPATNAAIPMPSAAAPPPGAAGPARVLVVGDSVAFTLAQGLGRVAEEAHLSVWNQARIGCGVLRGERVLVDGNWSALDEDCVDWPTRWRAYVEAFDPDAVVLLAGAWDLYDREVGGHVLEFGSRDADEYLASEVTEAVDVLGSAGATVFLLTTPYYTPHDIAVVSTAPRFEAARIDALNGTYNEVAERLAGRARVLDLNGFVASASSDGMRSSDLSGDGVHFTNSGADVVARWLARALGAVVGGRVPGEPTRGRPLEDAPLARWSELLQLVPDMSETRAGTAMNDYARYRALFAIAPPVQDAASEMAYYRALLFSGDGERSGLVPAAATGIGDFPPRFVEAREGLGYGIGEIAQDASAGGAFQLVVGPQALTPVPVDGGRSLGAHWHFVALARALDAMGTYTALLSDDVGAYTAGTLAPRVAGADADHALVAATRDALLAEPSLVPFVAFATGAGVDETGGYTALVLLHEHEAAATFNAELLRQRIEHGRSWLAGQPFSELIDGAEITADGALVVAKLRADSAGFWYGLHAAHDTLLLHD
jgi:peptidoglycan/LPS O-acetylase OafA/YrhL